MAHFDDALCADFVRGILGAKDRVSLERHLPTCTSCGATVRWLRDVAMLASADEQYEPPRDVLIRAGAVFATAYAQDVFPPPRQAGPRRRWRLGPAAPVPRRSRASS
jgi:anti-sigma-K factor RskA